MMKSLISNVLHYLSYKVDNDLCTPEEIAQYAKVMTENIKAEATISDIARHFGQSESNVRNLIARKCFGKPKRRVYYDFVEVAKNVPPSWHKQPEQHA